MSVVTGWLVYICIVTGGSVQCELVFCAADVSVVLPMMMMMWCLDRCTSQ